MRMDTVVTRVVPEDDLWRWEALFDESGAVLESFEDCEGGVRVVYVFTELSAGYVFEVLCKLVFPTMVHTTKGRPVPRRESWRRFWSGLFSR